MREQLAQGTDIIPPHIITYKCEACEDRGFTRNEIEDTKHPLFGKLIACPTCRVVKVAGISTSESGLHPQDYLRDWNNLLDLPGHNIREILRAVKWVLRQYETGEVDPQAPGYGWVYLHGSYGLGKTDILKTVVARCIQRGIHARYLNGQQLMNDMYSTIEAGKKDKEDYLSPFLKEIMTIPVLCLDEFDKIHFTDWGSNQFFLVLNYRWEMATANQSVTLFASNLNYQLIQDEALRSRMSDERFVRIRLEGTDVRLVSKQLQK